MSSRTIITTKDGHKIHSSITVETIVVEYADGTTDLQTPINFIRNNPLFDCLTTREQETLRDEIVKKLRYLRSKYGLNDD